MSTNNQTTQTDAAVQVPRRANLRWRVVDIAVASVIGVASAFIYWAAIFIPWDALQAVVPGFAGVVNGFWLFAGPLAAIIVRKPGAAIYAELLAAILEALMGNQWGGAETILIGLVQGVMAEIIFLIFAYRVWNVGTAILSGALAGVGCWGYSFFTKLQAIDLGGDYGIIYLLTTVISGAVVAGLLTWLLYVGIAGTGVLDRFESGRAIRGTVA